MGQCMSRIDDMQILAKELLSPRFEARLKVFQKDSTEYATMKREYRKAVLEIVQRTLLSQQTGKFGVAKYLSIFYLRSSIITETYDFAISLTNERYCLDSLGEFIFWCPKQIFENIAEDIQLFEKAARKHWVRIHPYEVAEIKRLYVKDHYQLAAFFFGEETVSATLAAGIEQLKREHELKFLYGGYMDQTIQFASLQKGQEHEILFT